VSARFCTEFAWHRSPVGPHDAAVLRDRVLGNCEGRSAEIAAAFPDCDIAVLGADLQITFELRGIWRRTIRS